MPSRSQLTEIARKAMLARGLQPDFTPAAEAEARAISTPSPAAPDARDLRKLLWASIDNDDSRDLDQLSVAEPLADGAVRILVAIADVEGRVAMGSAIDDHAHANTTSVYTAARIFPMLPEKLSTGLTSLNEGEERSALVADLTVAASGAVTASDVYPALVFNHAKLAYNAVDAWLDGNAAIPPKISAVEGMEEQIRIQDRVAHAMRQVRSEQGALSLATIEARVVFDGDVLTDVRPDEKNRAKDLIEDFMIAANTATTVFLERKGQPSLRRVLRSPERWDRIVALAAEFGDHLTPAPSATALQEFLTRRRAADPARFPDVSLSVVKLLGSGEYVVELPGRPTEGHFGLAVKDYTHSTAPNRRYPDLATQRLLKAALAGRPCPYTPAQLDALAQHCTVQEDNAAKVERQVRKSAAALLLSTRTGESFDGIVTGASSKGTWVRVFRPTVEGRVVKGFEGLDVGDRVRVQLTHTNVERGFIDFVRESH
jgi:VacB/RNase II family 3'-5' exoribonuclease